MADRPMLFSGPMVRALLAGTKTQTRRILKPQPEQFPIDDKGTLCEVGVIHVEGDALPRIHHGRVITAQKLKCAVGDRLWVREAHAILPRTAYRGSIGVGTIAQMEHPTDDYSAALFREGFDRSGRPLWRPSIHMPRWASRLTLTVTDVRVERLQSVSEQDAWAEGCAKGEPDDVGGFFPAEEADPSGIGYRGWDNARDWYADLWDHINGEGAWEANPWVAAYTFTVHQGNIDAPA
ncbi:hypothetical protein JP75_07785 [Devosia riboflavina]|uniref:ASCH domain-containing protein n=1 Tax=Devosia riboflavina TaxID=46914 RepID=A0A087M3J2_9HYPH|nr:hypothetical protein [Devosia riboflavina]KFL31445.1 hypothetical protein JP75_07785 [Devosia riboflavina]